MEMPISSASGRSLGLSIPRIDDLAVFSPTIGELQKNYIVGFDGRDNRSRTFKLLRTQFAKRIAREDARLIGFTSAAPEAGKSFVSLNLAAALSLVATHPVYLVDLDLRRGSIGEQMGMDIEVGISDFLLGKTDDVSAIGQRVEGTRLGIFPTAKIAENTAEVLAGDRFSQLIDAFRNIGDEAIILFDLPPVFANDDAMIVMEKLDCYIMIVDTGKSTRRQVRETIAVLQPTPCIGAVLNRYSGGLIENYGYNYGYYSFGKYDT